MIRPPPISTLFPSPPLSRSPAADHTHARHDEGTAGEDRPRQVPGQPARHHRDGSFEISEMGYAEGDQTQAVKHPRDAQTLVAGGETEALTVPVTGEPRVENPSGRRHHRGVTAGPPSNRGSRSTDDKRHPKQQQ